MCVYNRCCTYSMFLFLYFVGCLDDLFSFNCIMNSVLCILSIQGEADFSAALRLDFLDVYQFPVCTSRVPGFLFVSLFFEVLL